MVGVHTDKATQKGKGEGTNENILEDLKLIAVKELELAPEELSRLQPDSPIIETLNLDSLAQAVFIFAIEDHYGVTFELEDTAKIKTLKDIIDLIKKNI